MNIRLTPELEKLVDEKVKSGMYDSPSQVIHDALCLLKEQDYIKQLRREELRKEIQKGVDDIRAGRYITLETPEDYEKFQAQIIKEATESLTTANNDK